MNLSSFQKQTAFDKNQLNTYAQVKLLSNLIIKYLLTIIYFKKILKAMQGKEEQKSEGVKNRFHEFEDQFDVNGVKIGFKITGNDFLFEYDNDGGWRDEKGDYYNSQGVLIEEDSSSVSQRSHSSDEQDDDEYEQDQGIVDEFENMLIEEERGKTKSNNKQKEAPTVYLNGEVDYAVQAEKYVNQLINKVQRRAGLPEEIFVYFKMRSNMYEPIKAGLQKIQTVKDRNTAVMELRKKAEQRKIQLLKNNPWIKGDFILNYSGSSLDEGTYHRYWYGMIKTSPKDYKGLVNAIYKSKQFALLRSKSFYALKSKFYLKTSMKSTIEKLLAGIQNVEENGAIEVRLNNLPEDFPMSFLLDLVEMCGGSVKDIEEIDIEDEFTALMIVKKGTAQKIMNLEGYCHDEKQYIWLEVEDLKREAKLLKQDKEPNKIFNVEVDSEYKTPFCELYDTMLLQSSYNEVAKIFDKDEKNFRLTINQNILSRILMFRGSTLNIVRVVRYEAENKKESESKKE